MTAGAWLRTLVLAAAAVATAAGPPAAPGPADEIASEVLEALQGERAAAGLPPLRHRADLDAVAAERAARIARLPEGQRLVSKEPVADVLLRSGVRDFREVWQHIDLKRGYDDYARAFLGEWLTYDAARRELLSPANDAIGLAVRTLDDGWTVHVALLIQTEVPPEPADLRELERRTVAAVNEIRSSHGLEALALNDRVAGVARAHSVDMARQHYFDHRSAGGALVDDRLRRAGIRWSRVGENIQRSKGTDDPARTAAESWLASPGHRGILLGGQFTETGVGIAVDDDGVLYITQVFVLPE